MSYKFVPNLAMNLFLILPLFLAPVWAETSVLAEAFKTKDLPTPGCKDDGLCAHVLANAAILGGSNSIKALLSEGIDIDSKDNTNGNTAVLILLQHFGPRWRKALKVLLAAGADVNAENNSRETALIIASKLGYLKLVKLLLSAGADVLARGTDEGTALIMAARFGHPDVVQALIDAGADVDADDEYQWTALMSGSFLGDLETVQILFDEGADINHKSNRNETAIDIARNHGHSDAVALLEAGAARTNDP